MNYLDALEQERTDLSIHGKTKGPEWCAKREKRIAELIELHAQEVREENELYDRLKSNTRCQNQPPPSFRLEQNEPFRCRQCRRLLADVRWSLCGACRLDEADYPEWRQFGH